MRLAVSALLIAAAATPVLAQTPGPTPAQIVTQQQVELNRFQAQLQAEQLQQMQRQNLAVLPQADPNTQAEALARHQQIQQQIDQNAALQQQMNRPDSNPAGINAQLQLYSTQIQQLKQQPVPPVR